MTTLLSIGAGPKTLAVAAKAAAMRGLGVEVPRVVAVEAHAVGGNWMPTGGWTDGRHRLGTSPEKDVGFPYRSNVVQGRNRELNRAMQAYSWTAYLVDLGTFADWIDRGRPSPVHTAWARYLQWVAEKVDMEVVYGRVVAARTSGSQWQLTVEDRLGAFSHESGEALMVTGPGPSTETMLAGDPSVLGVAEFWSRAGTRSIPVAARAAVIGGGETAGTVVDELARHDVLSISVISPRATLFTRGESYFENSLYSDPSRWASLPHTERAEFIARTDRGVFSVRVQDSLLSDNRIQHVRGRVTSAVRIGESITLTVGQDRQISNQDYDLVIDARGVSPLWFTDLLEPSAADSLELALGRPVDSDAISSSIGYDLSVEHLTPTLFLPSMAGYAQGPGFPNLSCLGTLSDRVIGGMIAHRSTRRETSERKSSERPSTQREY